MHFVLYMLFVFFLNAKIVRNFESAMKRQRKLNLQMGIVRKKGNILRLKNMLKKTSKNLK